MGCNEIPSVALTMIHHNDYWKIGLGIGNQTCLPTSTAYSKCRLNRTGHVKMNAIRIDKREFTINGDTAIHTPTGAKFFAEPGGVEVVNWDWGTALPGRLMDEYEEQELLAVAAEVLEERFVV